MSAPHPPLPRELAAVVPRSFLAHLPAADTAAILAGGVMVEGEPGRLITEGRTVPSIGLVVDGLLRMYLDSGTARQVTVRYARPGDVLGLVHRFGATTEVQLQAITRLKLWMVSAEVIHARAQVSVAVALAVAQECAARAADMVEELALVSFGAVRARLARHLLDLAAGQQHGGELVAAVTQQQLADAVGSVREVVTRVLQGLRAEGCIAGGEAGVVIRDAAALDAVARERERSRG